MFRVVTADDADDYHEFTLARRGDGRVVATDVFAFVRGELVSEALRRSAILWLARTFGANENRFGEAYRDLVRHAHEIKEVELAWHEGRYADGLRIIRALPEALQREKYVLAARLLCAQQVDVAEWLAAAEAIRAEFKGEPWTELVYAKVLFERGDYTEALACLDRLNQFVGHDPYLDTYRAYIYLAREDYAAARRHARMAINGGDARATPYFCILTASLSQNQHDETLDLLKQLAERFDVVLDNFEENERYADFLGTPQHRAWQEYVAKRARNRANE